MARATDSVPASGLLRCVPDALFALRERSGAGASVDKLMTTQRNAAQPRGIMFYISLRLP
jgi:hypothetical protein